MKIQKKIQLVFRKIILGFFAVFITVPLFSQTKELPEVGFNDWELIIYRPENKGDMNYVRCWLKIENEDGNDVTYTAIRKAVYQWIPNVQWKKKRTRFPDFFSIFQPDVINQFYNYRKTYYLDGGMAMHLNIKPGKYKIQVYTPSDKTNLYNCDNEGDFLSDIYVYDTENPLKVLFVSPTFNENGFYAGGWHIDYVAPRFY